MKTKTKTKTKAKGKPKRPAATRKPVSKVDRAIKSMHACEYIYPKGEQCTYKDLEKLPWVCAYCSKRFCTGIHLDNHHNDCKSKRAPVNNKLCNCIGPPWCDRPGWCKENPKEHAARVKKIKVGSLKTIQQGY